MSQSQNRRLSCQVNIGLTQSEADHIDAAAKAAGISRASFARRHVLTAVGQVDATPGRKNWTALPAADVAAVAGLAGNVGRAAGATVQLAKALRESGHVIFHAHAENVLADLRRQSADLTTIIEKLK